MTTPQRVARDQAGERTRYEDIEVGAAEMLRAMATPGPAKKWPTGGPGIAAVTACSSTRSF